MDKTRDVMRKASRSSPAKRHFDDQLPRTHHSANTNDNDNIFSALERLKREKKLKKLSSVCEKSRSFVGGEMKKGSDVSPREEDGVEFVGAAKKLKLPRKLLGDCNAVDKASVPRKLRSAMKKRNRESLSKTLPDSKKMSHSVRGGESHKKNGVKKFKKERNSGWSLRAAVSGSMTKDEEEVAEALYALAGISPNNATNDNASGGDSLKDDRSGAVPEVTEGSTLSKVAQGDLNSDLLATGDNDKKPSKETTETISLSEPNLNERHVLLGSTDHLNGSNIITEAKLQQTPLWSNKSEQSYEKLHSACDLGFTTKFGLAYRIKQPDEMSCSLSPGKQENNYPLTSITGNQLEHQDMVKDSENDFGSVIKGTAWSLCASSTTLSEANILLQSRPVKMPPWLDAAVCSMKPGSVDTCLSTQKVFQTSVDKRPWKRCAAHVQICHLIRLLQVEESKDSLLKPKQIKQDEVRKPEQFALTSLNGFHDVFSGTGIESDTKRRLDEVRSVTLLPKNHIRDRQVACPPSIVPKSEKQAFDFLSLSAGGGGVNSRNTIGGAGRVDNSEARTQLSFPYIDSLTQRHVSMGQNRYLSAYCDQLSAVALQQGQMQLPGFLGSSGYPSALSRPMFSAKEQQHQQLLWAAQFSAQCKAVAVANSKTMAQYPSWQGEIQGSPTLIPRAQAVLPPPPSALEILGPKYTPMPNHLHHQLPSLNSSMPHHDMKRQDRHPHSVYQETTARFYTGGSLPLQLLCNERL
ncbi:uncharacterized protein LOC115748931 isoform X1 [Rhodamnia argentea]|uniref:Uncharacterized protein LOC115748931 isoform X1 n=2 Tax=Rhodamnia argentea TaxID=178133 RepID=A0A8B8Q4L4_9MYRT|nr:uncharacterized protein LOC115748931 isoform X1 [Rhodamnia argentea]XP_030541459.1 uncharacterized protein LOC115748931 isoform X1 [Rhodamnia argentea]XP_030541460.1 uncharacterized protein LOC115748931 isoform X1 [Rhodamnia argentea]XP_030541461.1 uncharacterized protein LOC115748931 isoform X1 [Rhodamnia argentea]XP_030541462.1 uncharacterized protein LOC115748931 isoform X1 [Rhodamnia argentea]XP_048130252.1 uncharacterized protein LOC115748931 isoform X1 [Rhodamnia argentea]